MENNGILSVYVALIQKGHRTIEEVPERIRKQVINLLAKAGEDDAQTWE